MDIFSLLKLLLGLTFFMFGMKVMSENLERVSGGQLEKMLKKATSVPIISLLLGAAITIAIQSSSATTVMLVGLVNSGIMSFSQTIAVIFGANIGTTLTAWILSLSGIDSEGWVQLLKPENFSPLLGFIGIVLCMFSKSEKKNNVGSIFVGFAVLMYGMEFMKDAVAPLQEIPQFTEMMVSFSNPVIGVLVGAVFTALIQSSAASVGILQALSLTGGVTFSVAIPIVMGQNIGTCITSVISSIGTSTQAKRVAAVHTLINFLATVFVLVVFYLLNAIVGFGFMDMAVDPVMIALIHTVFNMVATVLLMPLTKQLVKLTEWLVKDKKAGKDANEVLYLDERLLLSPSIAIAECDNATKKMMRLSKESLFLAMSLFDKYDQAVADKIKKLEDDVDIYEDKLGTYLVKLSSKELSARDSQVVSKMLHTIGDFERLSDHAVNLSKATKEMNDKGITFSVHATAELKVLADAITEILILSGNAYEANNSKLAGMVEPLEQVIDHLTAKIKGNHIERMRKGNCSIEMGFILSDILGNYQRISDHCSNIAVAIIEAEHNSFDTHKYLNSVKYGNNEFDMIYESFAEKYKIV